MCYKYEGGGGKKKKITSRSTYRQHFSSHTKKWKKIYRKETFYQEVKSWTCLSGQEVKSIPPQDRLSIIKSKTLVLNQVCFHVVSQTYINLDAAPCEFRLAYPSDHSSLMSDLLKAKDKVYGWDWRPEQLRNKTCTVTSFKWKDTSTFFVLLLLQLCILLGDNSDLFRISFHTIF